MGFWGKARKQVQREAKRIDQDIQSELRRFRDRIVDSSNQSANQPNDSALQLDESVTKAALLAAQKNPPVVVDDAQTVNEIQNVNKVETAENTSVSVGRNPMGLKPGMGFIINHKTFADEQLSERVGSEVDVKRVEEVFQNFQLISKTLKDGSINDVERLMAEVEDFDFTSYSCLVLVIMSHGYERDVLAAKDGHYSLYKDVLYPILRNDTLVGKTKMLFVQSCKGLTDLSLTTDARVSIGQPTKTPDEILQFNSCVEGFVSYRSPTDGSLFIQILCDKLIALGDTEDIRAICNKVIGIVKGVIYDMQIPMMHTNLTKPFVLGHYKE